jgi:hypothetical protein
MMYEKRKFYKFVLLESLQLAIPFLDKKFKIETKFFKLENSILYIYKGYAWDGPSFVPLFYKKMMYASLVHDVLYQMIRDCGLFLTYKDEADELFYNICLNDGVNPVMALFSYKMVDLFGYMFLSSRKITWPKF